ncbi:MAG: 6-pyruvoyl tetrahydropterin synthase family protein [Candidatus Heimdallarchaeota archaeon]
MHERSSSLSEQEGESNPSGVSQKDDSNKPGYEIRIAHPSLKFSSAHFLTDHEKCGSLHGHNYYVSLLIAGQIRESAMLIDFIHLKKLVREECALLDHKILIPIRSPFFEITSTEKSVKIKAKNKFYMFPLEDCVLLDLEAITSELLALYFWRALVPHLPGKSFSVFIEETPGAVAKYGST